MSSTPTLPGIPSGGAPPSISARLDRGLAPLDPADSHPPSRQALLEWLQLQATLGLHPEEAVAGLCRFGGPERALRATGRAPVLDARGLDASVRTLERMRCLALPILAPAYPGRVRNLRDAAPLLLCTGAGLREDDSFFERDAVAIVGSRAATAYGLGVARRLATQLAGEGVAVISGLARGIDAAAHTGALDGGGVTIAVQACGPDRIYPAEHRSLAARICQRGVLLTEMPPGTPPRAAYFPLRNRLIAALARIVVVVEARTRSGSLITARHALDQGVEVMAVPGPIDVPTSAGPNALVCDGARPVCGVRDILEELGREECVHPAGVASPAEDGAALSPRARRLLESLARGPASPNDLTHRLGWGPEELALPLLELELRGRVLRDRDGRLRAVAGLGGAG